MQTHDHAYIVGSILAMDTMDRTARDTNEVTRGALRAKLAEMETDLRTDERDLEQHRLRVECKRADVEATRRVVGLFTPEGKASQATLFSTTTGASVAVFGPGNTGKSSYSAVGVTHGAPNTNGAAPAPPAERPGKMDGHFLAVVKESVRPLSSTEIRDEVLKRNIPGSEMLIGSTYLYNVLNRLTKRGYLRKIGEGFVAGAEPPPREPVNWERCRTILVDVGRPLSFVDVADHANQRWGLAWEPTTAKWAMKSRRQVFEAVNPGAGLWGLVEWPAPLKAAYKTARKRRKRRART